MSDVEQIFSDFFQEKMSDASVTEANDRTIPGGTYRFDIVKKDVSAASDASPWPGREMVKVTADALYKNGTGEYQKRGRITFDVSPREVRLQKDNRLDNQSRLWANLVAVVGRGSTHQDVLDYLGQYPLTGTVSRTFKTTEGKWVTPKTEQEEKDILASGAEPRNFVQSLRGFNG